MHDQTPDRSEDFTNPSGAFAEDVTRDAFLGGKVELLQPATGFRAGLDAVLLAASIPLDSCTNPTLLDCGAGIGTVGICATARCPNLKTVLIEREPRFVDLAQRNIALNALPDHVRVMNADITAPGRALCDAAILDNSFSHVVANPPFFVTGKGSTSPHVLKAAGHEMEPSDLDLWVRFMTRMSKADGQLVMIQHAAALPAILAALKGRFGGARVVPIYPRAGEAAHRVIVAARKGSRASLSILSGFILHGSGNAYTTKAEAVLKHGAALEFFRNERT